MEATIINGIAAIAMMTLGILLSMHWLDAAIFTPRMPWSKRAEKLLYVAAVWSVPAFLIVAVYLTIRGVMTIARDFRHYRELGNV